MKSLLVKRKEKKSIAMSLKAVLLFRRKVFYIINKKPHSILFDIIFAPCHLLIKERNSSLICNVLTHSISRKHKLKLRFSFADLILKDQ